MSQLNGVADRASRQRVSILQSNNGPSTVLLLTNQHRTAYVYMCSHGSSVYQFIEFNAPRDRAVSSVQQKWINQRLRMQLGHRKTTSGQRLLLRRKAHAASQRWLLAKTEGNTAV